MHKHQRRPLDRLDHLRDGVGLAGARNAQQYLVGVAVVDACDELINGGGLIASRAVVRVEAEGHLNSVY